MMFGKNFHKQISQKLDQILAELKSQGEAMATGLSALQAAVAAATAATNQLIADVQKLLAGQSSGPGPGQVIVNQSDIDALTSTVTNLTASEQAADATVNPPAPSPAP